MKVKELIEKLSKLHQDYEVITYIDYDEAGTGTIDRVYETDTYDEDGEENGKVVKLSFILDGHI